jgi:hypothetical protein
MTKSVKGYCYDKEKDKFKLRINVNGRRIHIGYFKTVTEAEIFYKFGSKLFNGKELSWSQDLIWRHYIGLKSKDFLDWKLNYENNTTKKHYAIESAFKELGYI